MQSRLEACSACLCTTLLYMKGVQYVSMTTLPDPASITHTL
jgi:hypothetical protein